MRNSTINPGGIFHIKECNVFDSNTIMYCFAYYHTREVFIYSENGRKQKMRNENAKGVIRGRKLKFTDSNIDKMTLLQNCQYIEIAAK